MLEYGNIGSFGCIALTTIPAFHYSTIPHIQNRTRCVKSFIFSICFRYFQGLMALSQPVDTVGAAIGTDALPRHSKSSVPYMPAAQTVKLCWRVFISGFGIPGSRYPNLCHLNTGKLNFFQCYRLAFFLNFLHDGLPATPLSGRAPFQHQALRSNTDFYEFIP